MAVRRLPGGVTASDGPNSLGNQITVGPDGQPMLNGYSVAMNADGGYDAAKNNWLQDVGVPLGVASIFGYGALGPGGYAYGPTAGGTGAAQGVNGVESAINGGGAASGAAGAAGAGGTVAGTTKSSLLSKLFGKGGAIDPTTLLLGGLSLLGQPPHRNSFSGAGAADPKASMQHLLQQQYALENKIAQPVVQLRPNIPQGPAPVNIPGIPFQIGGGLGRDPAADALNPANPVKLRTPNG